MRPAGDLPEPQLAAASAPAPALDTIPIEQIRVGQRVLTGAAAPDKTLPTAVDEQTWRHLTLEETETWSDGTVDRICVESLLPPDWLALYDGAPVGSRVPIPLDLEEMGLPEGMTAQVVANEPCPPIDHGPGRVVLTTVNHLNPRVVELTLQVGTDGPAVPEFTERPATRVSACQPIQQDVGVPIRETVRPTAFHKFYSETRQAWLSAEDLQPGETLRGLSGPLQVVSQRPVPGTHRVYNMTVEGEHVYHVSTLGVLAHNNRCRVGYSREYTEGFDQIERASATRRSFWNDPIETNGRRVYRRNDLFDPHAADANGMTNLERMQKGRPPIGHDGEAVNLHHLVQQEPGPIVEVGGRFHSENTKTLHGLVEDRASFRYSPDGKTTEAEKAFRRWSYRYWQDRARGFE